MSKLQAVWNPEAKIMNVVDPFTGLVVGTANTTDSNAAINIVQAELDQLNPFKDSI